MEHYAGGDVSLQLSSVCVVDAQGAIVKEAKVTSESEGVAAFFERLGFAVKRIGRGPPPSGSTQDRPEQDSKPSCWRRPGPGSERLA